jgi:twinkle protein
MEYDAVNELISEEAKHIHGQGRVRCPACGDERKKKHEKTLSITVEPDKILYNCWHCNLSGAVKSKPFYKKHIEQLPVTPPVGLTDRTEADKLLAERGISSETAKAYGLLTGRKYFGGAGEIDSLGFAYRKDGEITAVKWRGINKKAFTQSGAAKTFYGVEQLPSEIDTLVIVEGEFDVLACHEAGVAAVSVPNGAPQVASSRQLSPEEDRKFSYVWSANELIDSVDKVILACDDDAPGNALREELCRRVDRAKCWSVTYPEGCKDINDVLIQHGSDGVNDCIDNATPMPLVGIHQADRYRPDLVSLYDKGVGSGESTGLQDVDELFTIMPGLLYVVTGVPGSGKSEFIDQIMVNMAQNLHWKFAVCSFENPPAMHMAKLAEKITGKTFYAGLNRMTHAERDEAADFINDHFIFLDNQGSEPATIDSILDRAQQAVRRLGVRGICIDPFNYLEQPSSESNESLSISTMITKVTAFAKAAGCAVFFVAHPSKLYPDQNGNYPIPKGQSISGSAAWFAKADVGLTVHRQNDEVQIHVWKVRFKWLGRTGHCVVDYDVPTGRYSDHCPVHFQKMTGNKMPWLDG